jgi:DNA-directed RNA polymerase subunit RPC12/RpoP
MQKKCELEVHSEGILRRHKVIVYDANESKQNIILGFEYDMQRFAKILEGKGELEIIKCEDCDYKTFSKGKLTLHKHTNHQG